MISEVFEKQNSNGDVESLAVYPVHDPPSLTMLERGDEIVEILAEF